MKSKSKCEDSCSLRWNWVRASALLLCAGLAVAIANPGLAQPGTTNPDADYDPTAEGYDEYGLPNLSRTEHRRRAGATDPNSETGSGWGATAPRKPSAASGWGGTVVDRTPGGDSSDRRPQPRFCDVSDQQFDLALRRADLAMAEGSIDRWFNAILPLVQARCDRVELTQRIEQAGRMEAAADRQRDQQVADATRWSRSRLAGRTTIEPGSAPSEWLEVANGLANLGLALRAEREGRPAPPPQTIVSQGPDGSMTVTLPEQAPPPGPDPAIARAAEERRAEMRRMAEEARRATNLTYQNDPKLRGAPQERPDTPQNPYPPATPPGREGADYTQPADDKNCNPAGRSAGARCVCEQDLFGIASCYWQGGEAAGRASCSGIGWCRSKDFINQKRVCQVVGTGTVTNDTTWVAVSTPGNTHFNHCQSNHAKRPSAIDFGFSEWDGFEVLSSHQGDDQLGQAVREIARLVEECNAEVKRARGRTLGKDLSHCQPPGR